MNYYDDYYTIENYDWVKDLEAPDDPDEFDEEFDENEVEYESLDDIFGPPQEVVVIETYTPAGVGHSMNIYGFENEDQYWEASWFAGEEDGI